MGIIPVGAFNDNSRPIESAAGQITDNAEGPAIRKIAAVKVGGCILGYETIRQKRRKGTWKHFRGRLAEIEKIVRHRHGPVIPETDDAFIYPEVIASLAFVEYREDFADVVLGWCAKWMPWAPHHQVEELIYERTQVLFSPLSADALGRKLHLSLAERCALDIRTIGAFDSTKRQRTQQQKQKRRQRDRDRKSKQRRAAGALTRETYLANALTQTRPWESFGLSRRQWERNGKPSPQTSPQQV